MERTYQAKNREELILIINKHGKPQEVKSDIGSYVAYDTDSENDVFDEAMYQFCMGADIVSCIY